MKILEILLPRGADRSLSPHIVRKIDALQQRMDKYVDRIMDPSTTANGKEFLKNRLRDDYYELKNLIPRTHEVAETVEQYEVYDRKTGEKVSGPYASAKRARLVRDKKDQEYGAVRYGVRAAGGKSITEAVRKLPLSNDDFDLVKEIMCKPIPAAIAPIYISEIIDDDEFNGILLELEDSDPGMDVRPLIVEWFNRVMPDQMFRFFDRQLGKDERDGKLSPIHGYDPKEYKGTNDPITGNAFGSY
jgi:hypothetical protein